MKKSILNYQHTSLHSSLIGLLISFSSAHAATIHPELTAFYPITVIPDVPALDITTASIQDGQYTAPHIPAIRTSNDGRVGHYIKRPGGNTRFFTAIRPEAITTDFDLLEPGIPPGFLSDIVSHNMGGGHHTTLCDGSSVFPDSINENAIINPKQCGDNDCYELSLISSGSTADGMRLIRSKFSVEIASPKTPEANIVNITQIEGDSFGPSMPNVHRFLEPMFTGDGRLVVFRMRPAGQPIEFEWQTNDGTIKSGSYDMVYGVIPDDAEACDITKMQGPYPITHAPFDAKVNNKYGFAKQPFRDSEGNVLVNGEPLKGTYPWIDREGSNIFFTAIRSRLFYNTGYAGIGWRARYDSRCLEDCAGPANTEDGLHAQGVLVMGAWTNGKMVLLDGAYANADSGLASTTDAQKEVSLYIDEQGNSVWERVGASRDTRDAVLPPMGAKNTTFIDSIENIFNYNPNLVPSTPRDVVWRFSTGRATADVAFDDFLNQHSIIIANMNASITHDVGDEGPIKQSYTRNDLNMRHNDGFDSTYTHGGRGFTLAPRIQNAATGPNEFTPNYGVTHGNIRIEPIAKGGIIGKGLWLDGVSGVSFDIGKPLDQAFVSVFLDPRQVDDQQSKRILNFADGSTLDVSHSTLRYQVEGSSEQDMLFEADLSGFALTDKTWRHLALQFHPVDQETVKIDVFLNGFLLTQWTTPQHQAFITGPIVLGALTESSDNGFRGWLDDFKVFAYRPDLESTCNHGYGTLVGIPADSQNTKWSQIASQYSATSHQRISDAIDQTQYGTYPQYACVHNYTEERGFAKEKAANPDLFTAENKTTLRQPFIFPEGPLHWNQPRPDSSNNAFCLECHVNDTNFAPLSVAALTIDTTINTQDDLRRQPMQPPRWMTGTAPNIFSECEYNQSILGELGTLVDQCDLPKERPSLESNILYRLIHVGTGYPVRVETWDTVAKHSQQGFPVTLETGGLDACDSAECDFIVKTLNDGKQSINPTNGVITRALGVLGLGARIYNGQDLSHVILRRNARLIENCTDNDCDFNIVPLGQDKFRIEAIEGYSIAKLENDSRLKTIPTEDCHSQVCEFEFVPHVP
ncbi:hypothetical protein [Marinomonas transparens]|uniref:LamG-like jellyroll fold domain-containing protein n=1 Tax=Marinomonas transparens TaxID=2795388 RepID=A0A934JTK6_9GAMM|nr:hypothetical protein [Marinomonas transparens]MBJ7539673.1 hypothetical protein [Marinomonas transparens]